MVESLKYQQGATLTLGGEGRKQLLRLLREHHESNPAAMDSALAQESMRYGEMRNATIAELCTMAHVCDLWKAAVLIHLNHVAKSYMKKHQDYFTLQEVEYGKEIPDEMLTELLQRLSPEAAGVKKEVVWSPKIYSSTPTTSAASSETETVSRRKRKRKADTSVRESVERKSDEDSLELWMEEEPVQHPLITPMVQKPASASSSSMLVDTQAAFEPFPDYKPCAPAPCDVQWSPDAIHQFNFLGGFYNDDFGDSPHFLDCFFNAQPAVLEPLAPYPTFPDNQCNGYGQLQYQYADDDQYFQNSSEVMYEPEVHYDGPFNENNYCFSKSESPCCSPDPVYDPVYEPEIKMQHVYEEHLDEEDDEPMSHEALEQEAWLQACAYGDSYYL
eukprot:Platyproteum_vivax@DN4838_c0_g1_i1.p1